MKITTSINTVNTNLTAITNRKTVMNSSNGDKRKGNIGRFDTFTMIGGDQKAAKGLSAEKAGLIRNLDNLSEEEKAETAVGSYIYMQRYCKAALNRYEINIYSFKSFQEEKAYYNELKSQGGVISGEGGKYAFSAADAGSVIDEKEIDAALSEAQERIDLIIMAPTEETERFGIDKVFRSEAQAFSEATGISDDALNLDDDSFCRCREGLTEEKYLEKTNAAVNSVKNCSQQLRNLMSDYVGRNPYAKELMMNPDKLFKKAEDTDVTPLAELLEQYREQIELTDTSESNLIYDLFSELSQKN